jgi:transcriptional regulator with XRE-family HTH domain
MGITASELGRRAGVSPSFLSEVERGRKSPSLATLDRLASELGVTRGALLPPPGTGLDAAGLPGRLTFARERAGLTQTRLAEMAGVTPGMVAQVESGAARPSLETLERLAGVLKVSPCHLLVDDPDLEAVLAGLTPEIRRALLDPDVQALLQSVVGLDRRCFVLVLEVVRAIRRHCSGDP